jgi:hypothetical protein
VFSLNYGYYVPLPFVGGLYSADSNAKDVANFTRAVLESTGKKKKLKKEQKIKGI